MFLPNLSEFGKISKLFDNTFQLDALTRWECGIQLPYDKLLKGYHFAFKEINYSVAFVR